MATQRLTVAKIGGKSADCTRQLFDVWRSKRIATSPDDFSDEQWPIESQNSADRWMSALRQNSLSPPVLFYVEYADLWSSSPSLRLSDDARVIMTRNVELLSVRTPFDDDLLKQIKRLAKRGQWQEDRWFGTVMLEAVEAWSELSPEGLIVIAREVTRGLFDDREVEASLMSVAPWVQDI